MCVNRPAVLFACKPLFTTFLYMHERLLFFPTHKIETLPSSRQLAAGLIFSMRVTGNSLTVENGRLKNRPAPARRENSCLVAIDGLGFAAARSFDRAGHAHPNGVTRAFLPADADLGARAGNFCRKYFAVVQLEHDLAAPVPLRHRAFYRGRR